MGTQDVDAFSGDTEPFSSGTRQRIDQQYHGPLGQTAKKMEDFTDILRIVPMNIKAKLAFDELVQKQNNKTLNQHHSQFIVTTGKGPLMTNMAHSRSSDETSDMDSVEASESDKELYHGYFRIDLECSAIRNDIKYFIGRGSGKHGPTLNVDVLLAVPRSPYTRRLQAIHAFLKLHSESGVWMVCAPDSQGSEQRYSSPTSQNASLRPTISEEGVSKMQSTTQAASNSAASMMAGSSERSSEKAILLMLDNKPLMQKDSRPLIRPSTNLEIAGMLYEILFMVHNPAQEVLYRTKRDHILEKVGVKAFDTIISGIPFDGDQFCPTAVFRHGLGSGTFGKVFEGFDRTTGDLRVVKKITLNAEHDQDLVDNEIRASQQFSGYEGIVTLYECSNSVGGKGTYTKSYPLEVCMVQEKGVAFNKHNGLSKAL